MTSERKLHRFRYGGHDYAVLAGPALAAFAPLTDAEREVALLVLAGISNARIAAQRKTSTRTVANQLASIYKKLGVRSRADLAAKLGV